MRIDVHHEICPIHRHETQKGELDTGNDHQWGTFDRQVDNVGVGRSMLCSKGILDVSSMVKESENDQAREYDIDDSGEWSEHCIGIWKLLVHWRHL